MFWFSLLSHTVAVDSVLARTHDSFGPNPVLCREDEFWVQYKTETSTTYTLASKTQTEESVSSAALTSKSLETVKTESATSNAAIANPSTITVNINSMIVKCLKKHPNELLNLLQNFGVNLDFDDKQGHVMCTSTKLTPFAWNNEAFTAIQSHVEASYTVCTYQIPKNAIQELCLSLCSLQDEYLFVYAINSEGTKLTLAGKKEVLSQVGISLSTLFESYTHINRSITLKPSEFEFLLQLRMQHVKERFPQVAITPDSTLPGIRIQGTKKEIERIQQALSQICGHSRVSVRVQSAVVNYFKTVEGRKQLDCYIQKSNPAVPVAVTFETAGNKNNLILLCDEVHTTSVCMLSDSLKSATDVVKHTVPASFVSLRSTVLADDYPALLSQMEEQHHVMINHPSGSNVISVSGFKEGTASAMKEILEFIQVKCTSTTNLKLEKGELRLLQNYGTKRWDAIAKTCQSYEVQIEIQNDEHSIPIVVIKGDREKVIMIADQISKIRKGICKANIRIERPGTCSFFQSESGRMYLVGIQSEENVAIEVSVPARADSDLLDESTSMSPRATKFIRKCVATKGMKKITIYVGDITEFEKADVTVNAANRELQHIGGVALSIANKGGPEIQKESNEHVRRKGKLETGEVWLTRKVGHLPCKALIHAVGPQWYGGLRKEEALLEKVCTEALKAASRAYRSVAFPAISSGVYGFPINICAKVMIKAIDKFCEKNALSDLEDVYIILHPSKASDAAHFISALKQQLPPQSVFVDEDVAHIPKLMPQYDISEQPSHSSKAKRLKTHHVSQNILDCVKLTKGSLLDVKVGNVRISMFYLELV